MVTVSPPLPHTHALSRLLTLDWGQACSLAACLASYAFDFVARMRLNGVNFSWGYMAELPYFAVQDGERLVRELQSGQSVLSSEELGLPNPPKDYIAEALLEELDEAASASVGLSVDDMRWILRPDNPDPRNLWRDYRERLKVLEAAGLKGKWYTLAEARELRERAGMEVDF